MLLAGLERDTAKLRLNVVLCMLSLPRCSCAMLRKEVICRCTLRFVYAPGDLCMCLPRAHVNGVCRSFSCKPTAESFVAEASMIRTVRRQRISTIDLPSLESLTIQELQAEREARRPQERTGRQTEEKKKLSGYGWGLSCVFVLSEILARVVLSARQDLVISQTRRSSFIAVLSLVSLSTFPSGLYRRSLDTTRSEHAYVYVCLLP